MDLGQGRVGDCYFLAAVSALAENPERIKRMFVNTEENSAGMYAVILAHHGKWRVVWVDDCFPVTKKTEFEKQSDGTLKAEEKNVPRYCDSKDTGKLWPLLLEKAFARVYGNGAYENLNGGFPAYALHGLTMCPTFSYDLKEYTADELWDIMERATQQGSALCAGCLKVPLLSAHSPVWFRARYCKPRRYRRNEASPFHKLMHLWFETFGSVLQKAIRAAQMPFRYIRSAFYFVYAILGAVFGFVELGEANAKFNRILTNSAGLVTGHAYAVLKTKKVTNSRGTESRIVQLRNPHGMGEWQGPFADKSRWWSDEAKTAVNLRKEDDGAFWMTIEDFRVFFHDCNICHGVDRQKDLTGAKVEVLVSDKIRETGICIEVKETCDLFVTVVDPRDQKSRRRWRWAMLVFNEDRQIVGKNVPSVRHDWSLHDVYEVDSQYSDEAWLSADCKGLVAGKYVIEVIWSEALKEKAQFPLMVNCTAKVEKIALAPSWTEAPQ
jgi:hypothetical protein